MGVRNGFKDQAELHFKTWIKGCRRNKKEIAEMKDWKGLHETKYIALYRDAWLFVYWVSRTLLLSTENIEANIADVSPLCK